MLIIFYSLLMLGVSRCTDEQIFEMQTVRVGVWSGVNFTCPRKSSGSLFWFRLVPGKIPQVLGKTYGFEKIPRITAKEEPGTFVLYIKNVQLSDTSIYCCVKMQQRELIFLKVVELTVQGPGSDITSVSPTDPASPDDLVTFQCSVLSDYENKTCPEEKCAGCLSHLSQPDFGHTQENSFGEHKKNSDGLSTKKCLYMLLKNTTSSEAGTYCCAATTCEEICSGNRSTLDTEEVNTSQESNPQDYTVLLLLCAALTISLTIIAFLIYSIKKIKSQQSCGCDVSVALQTNVAAGSCQETQATDEDSLIYSAATFTRRKASRKATKDKTSAAVEEECIYADVKALGLE